ncbi:hypothetical protein KC19_VG203500 [Ceratodon purpureus]|uniref:histone acetyltransferase n=1 Tax=Ceratodon purpureus TaxID=3225 RepID=A0A8T0HSI4_CERPU|nr:hypothetical protein KC19_VG203500 [Ceratodon purpureus]
MENEVTAMASGNRCAFSFRKHCNSCGSIGNSTLRMWECDVCRDYLLCENCYNESLEDSDEALSAPPKVHNRDHRMSAHVTNYECNGCESFLIWKQRWRCKVCFDFDLCEACHRGLGEADMSAEHSKEHLMIVVEVMMRHKNNMVRFELSFSKPVDPQWSYRVEKGSSSYDFEWKKRKSVAEILSTTQMSVAEDDKINQTPATANKETNGPIAKLKERRSLGYTSLSLKQASHTSRTQWSVRF